MERNVNLPEGAFIVTSRGVEVKVPLAKLSPEILAECLLHGLTQKVADAASQAKARAEESDDMTVEQATEAMMTAAVESLVAGEWSRRTGGGGVDEATRVARMVTKRLVKAKFGAKSPEWAKFTGLDTADQNAKLDEWFEANEAALSPERDAEIARRKEAAAAKAKAAKGLDISL